MAESDKSILVEAEEIVNGARASQYGDHVTQFEEYATLATFLLSKKELQALSVESMIPASVVIKVLMAVKMGREAFKHKRDNLVDLCGYAKILQDVQANDESEPEPEAGEP